MLIVRSTGASGLVGELEQALRVASATALVITRTLDTTEIPELTEYFGLSIQKMKLLTIQ